MRGSTVCRDLYSRNRFVVHNIPYSQIWFSFIYRFCFDFNLSVSVFLKFLSMLISLETATEHLICYKLTNNNNKMFHLQITWVKKDLQMKRGVNSKLSVVLQSLQIVMLIRNEPPHDKTNKMAYLPSEDSDQPGHSPSLIRVFTVRLMASYGPKLSSYVQQRLWSDWVDAQADLSLRWVHIPFSCFCHEVAQIKKQHSERLKATDERNTCTQLAVWDVAKSMCDKAITTIQISTNYTMLPTC